MIPDKLQQIMKQDGVVAIATLGPDGPHMVNTWNSYLKVSQDGRLFIPAGYMHKTEANVAHNPNVLITLGSSKVEGLHGMGAGFLIKGKARPPEFSLEHWSFNENFCVKNSEVHLLLNGSDDITDTRITT